jgi:hypothetical protein
MKHCKKIEVTQEHLFVNYETEDNCIQTVLFSNSQHDFNLLLAFLNEQSQTNITQVTLSTPVMHNYHTKLENYLLQHNIRTLIIKTISTKQTNKINTYDTRNLDSKTLTNRLGLIARIINREEKRLDEMVNKNSSREIISMVLKSINDYKNKKQSLELLINGK